MVLIGLLGLKGSGKDTCADYLALNYGFVKKSFADPLKRACKELFLYSDSQLYGDQKEIPDQRWFGCTPRKSLQFLGTDLLRDQVDIIMPGIGKNIFTHHFNIWYQEHIINNPDIHVVVADVRFQNEVDLLKSLGGYIIKLERNSIIPDTHVSEQEQLKIINIDHVIFNNSTKEDLYQLLHHYIFGQFKINFKNYDNYYHTMIR